MKTAQEIKSELANFTGTENYFQHPLNILYTDGIQCLASYGCYWLIDIVASWQLDKKVRVQEFQVFKLTVNEDRSAIISIEDGNDKVIEKQNIEYTDFPLDSITLFYNSIEKVLYLPTEH